MPENKDSVFGVALTRCYFCLEPDKIVLNTKLTEKHAEEVRKFHDQVVDMEPCPKCKELMDKGIIVITIDNEKSGENWSKAQMPNPYRTGGWFVLHEEAMKRIFHGEALEFALKSRWVFMEHEAAEKLGLFRLAEEQEKKSDESL